MHPWWGVFRGRNAIHQNVPLLTSVPNEAFNAVPVLKISLVWPNSRSERKLMRRPVVLGSMRLEVTEILGGTRVEAKETEGPEPFGI